MRPGGARERKGARRRPRRPERPWRWNTSGPHTDLSLPAGAYPSEVDWRAAVHSLEHGYVILAYGAISPDEVRRLEGAFRGERKLIITPKASLSPGEMALVSWRRLQRCKGLDLEVARAFIRQNRESRLAPEPQGP